jgi:NADH dehydrogenase
MEDKIVGQASKSQLAIAKHRIVIVGGGAGGLELAVRLGDTLGRRRQAEITLVDTALTHLWKPLLHEVAAGTLDSHADAIEFLAQARAHHFRFRLGRLDGLDRARKEIRLAAIVDEEGIEVASPRAVGYDTLVIAVGGTANDFGVPGVEEHCIRLDSQKQAEQFQRIFLDLHLRALATDRPLESGLLNVGIVGAGATGVELAAELHAASRQLVTYGLDRVSPGRDLRLVLVEAAGRVLPNLPERVSRATEERLRQLGVEIHTGKEVSQVMADGIQTTDGRFLPCRMKVWAAGIKAPDILKELDGLEVSRLNRLIVRSTLQTSICDDVFALGDCAECPWPEHDRPVPPRANAAHQQAALLAKSLVRQRAGKPLLQFAYRDRGSLVSLSRYTTLGILMGNLLGDITFEGWLARFAYRSLYRMHQRVVYGLPRMLLIMLADWVRRGAGPVLKLH